MQPNKERAAEIALCGALTCVAGAAYADFFSGWQFAVPVVGGAAAPALLVAVATQRGWRPGRAALVGVLVLPVAAAALLLALPGTGVSSVGDAAGTVRGGTVDGWAAMLAGGLPADLHGDLLVTPLALSWLASLAACLLAVHASGPIVPLGPPTAALAGSLALTGDAASNRLALAVAFLGLAMVLMLVRANRAVATALTEALPSAGAPSPEARASSPSAARLHTPAGRVAFGVPLVVGIAVASPLAAGALPPARGDRLDPRDLRDQRLEIDDALSPLVVLKSQLKADPSRPLFRITVDAGDAPTPDRVRTAALDAYDGALWTTTGDYRRAGHELPGDAALGDASPGRTVRQSVTILDLEGPFLPAMGRPVRIDAGADGEALVGFDPVAGTPVSARSSLRGLRYDVVSDVAAPGEEALAASTPSRDPSLDAVRVAPPNLPVDLAELATSWTADAGTRAGELLALRDGILGIRYDDSTDAEPGHNYGALLRVLLGDETDREGYAEQFAAAYAVLARTRGFPTRVAVGYRLREPDAGGAITVTEADAHAWPEVHLVGSGWVPIETTGRRTDSAPEPDDVQAPPGRPSSATSDASRPSPPVPPEIVEATVDGEGEGDRGVSAPAAGGIAAFVALFGLIALPAAGKRLRRSRRRRAGSAAARIVGAWRETVDRLVELGLPVPSSLTASEVARETRARFPQGAGPVGQLVPLLAVAVYAPFEPDGAAADRAWRLAGDARSSLRRGTGPGRRLRALVDPRPLFSADRQVRRAGRAQTAPPTAVATAGDAVNPNANWAEAF